MHTTLSMHLMPCRNMQFRQKLAHKLYISSKLTEPILRTYYMAFQRQKASASTAGISIRTSKYLIALEIGQSAQMPNVGGEICCPF